MSQSNISSTRIVLTWLNNAVRTLRTQLISWETPFKAIRHLIEAIGIIVAGFWIHYKYMETENPAIEKALGINVSSTIYRIDDSTTTVVDQVSASNFGKKTIDVDSVIIKVWYFPRNLVKQHSTFIIDQFIRAYPCTDSAVDRGPSLCRHYPVNTSFTATYNHFMNFDSSKSIIESYLAYANIDGKIVQFSNMPVFYPYAYPR